MSGSLAKCPAIILVTPSGEQIACGLDPQQRRIWKMFFKTARLRRVTRGGLGGCALSVLSGAVAICSGAAAWHLVDWNVVALQPFIGAPVAEKLPALSATVAAWAGFLGSHRGSVAN
jgi:hypothetical protein